MTAVSQGVNELVKLQACSIHSLNAELALPYSRRYRQKSPWHTESCKCVFNQIAPPLYLLRSVSASGWHRCGSPTINTSLKSGSQESGFKDRHGSFQWHAKSGLDKCNTGIGKRCNLAQAYSCTISLQGHALIKKPVENCKGNVLQAINTSSSAKKIKKSRSFLAARTPHCQQNCHLS